MNFFKNFSSYKGQIVEFYCKTLADACKYGGIHNYEFDKSGIVYKPQKSMIDFFIKVLQKTSRLGLTDSKIARELNRWNVQNLLCAEDRPWTELDTSRILSAKEGGLIVIN